MQEPYVYQNRVKLLDTRIGVVLAAKNKPRAAMYVRKDLEPWLVEEFTDRDLSVCTIKIDNKLWYLASVYMDITFNIKENNKLLGLVDYCSQNRIPLLLGMDCNAHSILWGSESTNARGEDLEDLILEKDLFVVNVGSVPTFQTIQARSVIDITLVNLHAQRELPFDDWSVDEAESHSDHKYINFSLGMGEETVRYFRNWKKFQPSLFRELLEKVELPKFREGENLEECYDGFLGAIMKAVDSVCPLRRAKPGTADPWWTAELTKLKTELLKLSDKRRTSLEHHDRYASKRGDYNRCYGGGKDFILEKFLLEGR